VNLQSNIAEELWGAVASVYTAGNYSHAILEAVHHLSSVLRNRSGVDGDGAALVGQAIGGDSPRIRVSSLQTDSERNVQKGIEQILRGIYLAIRNPRSHEPTNDSKETADAIIYFLNYILGILDASQNAFTAEGFIGRVLDPEFVEGQRYAELLISEIPAMKRGDALLAIYSNRRAVALQKRRHLVSGLLATLSEAQLINYVAVVSEELRTTTDDASIRTALQMLTPDIWPRVAEVARLRIENKLINGIKDGEIVAGRQVTQALATWSNSFLKSFSLRSHAAWVLIAKLENPDADHRHFVAKYFLPQLPEVIVGEPQVGRCIKAIAAAIQDNDENVRSALITWIGGFPQDWQKNLSDSLQNLMDRDNPAVILDDGTPFLSSPSSDEIPPDDDIPF